MPQDFLRFALPSNADCLESWAEGWARGQDAFPRCTTCASVDRGLQEDCSCDTMSQCLFSGMFAAGLYAHDESANTRNGGLSFFCAFRGINNKAGDNVENGERTTLQTVSQAAVMSTAQHRAERSAGFRDVGGNKSTDSDAGHSDEFICVHPVGTVDVGAGILDLRWLPRATMSVTHQGTEHAEQAVRTRAWLPPFPADGEPRPGKDEAQTTTPDSSDACSSVLAAVGADRALHILQVSLENSSAAATSSNSEDELLLNASNARNSPFGEAPALSPPSDVLNHQSNACDKKSLTLPVCRCARLARILLPGIHDSAKTASGTVIGVGMDSLGDDGRLLAACCSDGHVSVVKDMEHVHASWRAHEAEAWCIAFDPHEHGNTMATGADDCIVRLWDLRCREFTTVGSNEDESVPAALVMENKRSHSMGVTSITFFPDDPNLLLTGSYDEAVRIFDRRHLQSPLTSYKVSGGVWRLKWHTPEKQSRRLLLVAACHGGGELWRVGDTKSDIERLGVFSGHQSMTYGISALSIKCLRRQCMRRWSAANCLPGTVGRPFVASDATASLSGSIFLSCSFYDRLLAVW
ncbi:WD domain, G-beta repeat-containing protein [Toxoplasma gondii ARI]|uniref:methylated diphthine methylhydrolase n=1 Tax=Toxoplasma gondii ARI TaxID=1074872 RepID=A0A139XQR6_TOXGO|nr:WD domain, G-beta repeat-containing protein [Toxoplasma gondii ARI]